MPIQPLPKRTPIVETQKPAKSKRPLIILLLVVGGIVGAIMIVNYLNTRAFRESHRSEAESALQLMCEFGTNLGTPRCVEYAVQTLNADDSRIIDVYFCGEFYNPISDLENFATCIARDGVPLP